MSPPAISTATTTALPETAGYADGANDRTASWNFSSGSSPRIANDVVVTPLSKYVWILARHSLGDPCTTSSSINDSGIAATAPFRSPAFHASHIGCNCSLRPSQAWNAAYTGTFRYAAMANLAPARTTSLFSLGQTKIRQTISFSSPP